MKEKLPPTRTYWLSFDRWNKRIRYGRGYHMTETLELEWNMRDLLDDQQLGELFGPGLKLVRPKQIHVDTGNILAQAQACRILIIICSAEV